jgi:hypothetical protein
VRTYVRASVRPFLHSFAKPAKLRFSAPGTGPSTRWIANTTLLRGGQGQAVGLYVPLQSDADEARCTIRQQHDCLWVGATRSPLL